MDCDPADYLGVILLYRNVIYFLEDVFEIIPYEVYLITDRRPRWRWLL